MTPLLIAAMIFTGTLTTTEGVTVDQLSCNTIGAGYVCREFSGDLALAPVRLLDLCDTTALTASQTYVLSLEPTCNGSQYEDAWLSNWSAGHSQNCSSALPSCQLEVAWLDEVSLVVDVQNNEPGYDLQLRLYPLEGGRDDVAVVTTSMLASILFAVFVSRKKAESLGRGILFMVAGGVYVSVSVDGSYYVLLYYFYLFFEAAFSALDFGRYRLFATTSKSG